MKPSKRRYFTQADKNLMWDRWRKGESLNSIARLLGTSHSAISGVLSKTGGVRPAERQRSRIALTLAEREEISRGVAAGYSLRTIAAMLGRAPSTISREVKRNGGRQPYRANKAEQAAWDRAHRAKTCKLARNPALALIVAEKLQLEWSPRQIAGWLKYTHPDDENYQVSHETIYLTLFIQARGALKREIIQYLRKPRAIPTTRSDGWRRALRYRMAACTSRFSVRSGGTCMGIRAGMNYASDWGCLCSGLRLLSSH